MSEEFPRGVIYFPPARVVVETYRHGHRRDVSEAVSYDRAKARGIEPDVILVRDDRWTLGATWEDAQIAYETWRREWVFFVYREIPESSWKLGRIGLEFRKLVEGTLAAQRESERRS